MAAASASNSPTGGWQHPPSFYCPISRQCMRDPVLLCDGHTYERRHITRWLLKHKTSPVSGLELPQLDTFPNHALRNAIEEYFQQVLNAHRSAILKAKASIVAAPEGLADSASLVRRVDALIQCLLLLNVDESTECVLCKIMETARTVVGAESARVLLFDALEEELYCSAGPEPLRAPAAEGVTGRCAEAGEALVVRDVQALTCPLDLVAGARTRSLMVAPLEGGSCTIGAAQLFNKAENGVEGFTPEDLQIFQIFASRAAKCVATDTCAFASEADGSTVTRSLTENLAHASRAMLLSRNLAEELALSLSDDEQEVAEPEQPGLPSPPSKSSAEFAKSRAEEEDPVVQGLLEEAFCSWTFDALALSKATGNRPLSTLAPYLFQRLGLVESLGLDAEKLRSFFLEIEEGYDDGNSISYHNRAHGASALHAMHALLQHGGILAAVAPAFGKEESSAGLERMACLVAAAVHDYEHCGLTNDYLVRTSHERAVLYNDLHVNEQHHVAAAFAVLQKPENNFLAHLPAADFKHLRSLVIDLVIATDMAKGSGIIKAFQTLEKPVAFRPGAREEGLLFLQVAMKCADLGHLVLDWEQHTTWVSLLEREFFVQGDLERAAGMSVSFLMDRSKPGVTASQVGFFEAVVLPLYRELVLAAPGCEALQHQVLANCRRWRELKAGECP